MIKLINVYDLIYIIENYKNDLETYKHGRDLMIHVETLIHLLRLISEIPEFYNIGERINNVITELLNENEDELPGMYNSSLEHETAEEKMYFKNEIIDEVIEIVKKGFDVNV